MFTVHVQIKTDGGTELLARDFTQSSATAAFLAARSWGAGRLKEIKDAAYAQYTATESKKP